MDVPGEFDHPAWFTAAATLVSYGVVLAVLFALLFVVPFVVYSQVLA